MEETKNQHCEECCGHCHMHGMGGKYHLLRWVLGITIMLLVFWLGFKLGEFKGYFDDYGYGKGCFGRGMMNYGTDGNDYFQFRRTRSQDYVYPPMMWQWQQPASTTPTK